VTARGVRAPAALVAAAILAALPGCERDLPPDATYRALVRAVADRNEAAAWELLSAGTRKRLGERAAAAARAAPGIVSPDGRSLLIGDAALAVRPPRAITVVSGGPDRAVLRVEGAEGRPVDVVLLREGGAWRVDLPDR
jgi:hypothetical protein